MEVLCKVEAVGDHAEAMRLLLVCVRNHQLSRQMPAGSNSFPT